MKSLFFALAAVVALSATPAAADMVRGQSPASVAKALTDAGYAAAITTDNVGDPMINSQVAGTSFQILFYNCTNHLNCATVEFHLAFDSATATLAQLNDWNKSQRFARAFLNNSNRPVLEMSVDLDDGGMSPLLFIDNIEFWASIVPRFQTHIGSQVISKSH